MGSGGVAIAALPTVICFKVTFSDGLGGWFQPTPLGMRTKSEIEILNGQSAIDIDGVC